MTKLFSLSPEVLESRIAPAAAVFDLGNINGQNGFAINGELPDDQIGSGVSNIGDFNGDRLDDFIVGAPRTSANGTFSGGAYVIFGSERGIPAAFDVTTLDGSNGFKILGEAAGDDAGLSVSGAGDFNGDGRADVIIGAPGVTGGAGTTGEVGAAYILFGATSTPASLTLSDLANIGVKILGEAVNASFASSVAGAGDFNNDGFDDVIIGAPDSASAAGPSGGACYVIFGSNALRTPIGVASLTTGGGGFKVFGENVGDDFGMTVAGAGDVNGDGTDDIVIGAPGLDGEQIGCGGGYVIFGRSSLAAPISLTSLDGTNGFKFTGEAAGDSAGESVAAGDLNGDGFADIIVGARNADGDAEASGAVHVIYGKGTPFLATVDLDAISTGSGFKLIGATVDEAAGSSVRSAGDFNGDGIADLLIGAPAASANGELSGATYLVLGSKLGFDDVVNLAELDGTNGFRIDGAGADYEAGVAVSAAGDVNGDGYGDLLIGAPGASEAADLAGAAYVVYGFDTRLNPSANGKTFTFTEADGDVVTLKLSQEGLQMQDIVLAPDGSIASIDLSGFANAGAAQAQGGRLLNFTLNAKIPLGGSGNGLTKLGQLDAHGVSMGKIKIGGDLDQIFAGGLGDTAVKSLNVLGNLGGDGVVPHFSKLTGGMKVLKIGGNLQNDTFEITGHLRSLSVQKSLLGLGAVTMAGAETIAADGLDAYLAQGNVLPAGLLMAGSMGRMKIGQHSMGASIVITQNMDTASIRGNFESSLVFSGGSLKGMTIAGKMVSEDPSAPSILSARNHIEFVRVNGDVTNARILAGYNNDEQPVNPDATIGRVFVKGDWTASSIVAGIADVTNDGFGRNDGVIAGDSTPEVLSKIASVVIKGTATGSAAGGDHFGITAQQIGKVSINGSALPLNAEALDDILVDTTNSDFKVIELL